jgi:hypothetical protein
MTSACRGGIKVQHKLLFVAKEFAVTYAKSWVYAFVLGILAAALLANIMGAVLGGVDGRSVAAVLISAIGFIPHARLFYTYNQRHSLKRPLPVYTFFTFYMVFFMVYLLPAVFIWRHYPQSTGAARILYDPQMSLMGYGTVWLGHSTLAYLATVALYAAGIIIAILCDTRRTLHQSGNPLPPRGL